MKKQILTLAICLFVCITASQAQNEINGYEYVDLGLPSGLKWATCNVGANSPEDYGDYYSWGEIKSKSTNTQKNSKTFEKDISNIGGDAIYDVAQAKCGGTWRLPAKAEFEELLNNCQWEWTTEGRHKGYKVTGPNGKSIFLPAAGRRYERHTTVDTGLHGYYWSSASDKSNTQYACYLYLSESYRNTGWLGRYFGQSVRPVSE